MWWPGPGSQKFLQKKNHGFQLPSGLKLLHSNQDKLMLMNAATNTRAPINSDQNSSKQLPILQRSLASAKRIYFHASKRWMPQDLHANYLTHSVALRVFLERGKHQGLPNILYGFVIFDDNCGYLIYLLKLPQFLHSPHAFLLWVMWVWPWS